MRLTYRKISFLLLFLATMLLAAAWLGSLRTWRDCTVIAQPCTFHFSLRSGTAVVFVAPQGASGFGFHSTSYRVQTGGGHLAEYGPAGTFRLTKTPLHLPGVVGLYGYTLAFPVWFPYLIFVASVVTWMRVRSRQTNAATEKALALREAAERYPGSY